jgi:hypothetical protein
VLLSTTSSVNGLWCEYTGIPVSYYYYCPHGGGLSYLNVGQCINAPPCPAPQVRDATTGKCRLENYTLELTASGTSIEPGKDMPLTVTIKDQDQQPPKDPVTVKISLMVDPKSGGHDHGDNTRPRGGIDGKSCASDDTCKTLTLGGGNGGSASIIFNSRDAAGTHTVTATCNQCSNGSQSAEVKVKVEGLETIPASSFYAFTGSKTGEHEKNHNLTPAAAQVLWQIAVAYQIEQQFKLRDPATGEFTATPPVLHVNDASLEWGGLFDAVNSDWARPHGEHRRGTVVDLRANNASGAISIKNFKKFDGILKELEVGYLHECTKDKKSTPIANRHNRKWPGCISELDGSPDTNRHYHVRLMGVAE